MSSIMKVLLLLAVMVCISEAQLHDSGRCLCRNFRRSVGSRSDVKDIQIYRQTVFCNRVEIVVTMNSGLRYCLDPRMKIVKKLLANMMEKQKSTTTSPQS